MRHRKDALLGLDLSTTASAAMVVPLAWQGDWLLTRTMVRGYPLQDSQDEHERCDRNALIADEITQLAIDYRVGVAWIEGYAFGQVHRAHHLGELGGVVRLQLRRAGVVLRVANMGTARKLILGAVPRGKGVAKREVFNMLRAAGMPFRSPKKSWLDEADSFVVANLGLSEAGAFCFAQVPAKH